MAVRPVVAFDLDGTLTRRDTLLPFLRHACGGVATSTAVLAQSPRMARALLAGSRHDAKETLLARLLGGQDPGPLQAAAEGYAGLVVTRRLRPWVRERVEWHRSAGHQLVLISASPEIYVAPLARCLGFDVALATRLEVGSDGRLTGRIEGWNCRGPEKVARLRAWMGSDASLLYAYGDSPGDEEMLALADTAVRVGRGRPGYCAGAVVPPTEEFSGVTVILPAVTETDSLDETARALKETSDADIAEVLAVVCDRTTPESLARCQALETQFGERLRIHHQRLPFLGGAMREAFDLATASHVIMMASDLETDPAVVPAFIDVAKKQPQVVVTASRWASGGGFSGYGPVRVAANWVFQRLTSLVYRTHLTDATFGYRLFPTALVQAINWEGLRHEFLLETVLKPLRLGVEVVEVPTFWTPRREGESQNSLSTQARYLRTLLVERLQPQSRILRGGPTVSAP